MRGERGGIIFGGLLKIVVAFAILALVGFQIGAVVVAKVQVDGIAINAAQDAALEYGRSSSIDQARSVAEHLAEVGGATVTNFSVDSRLGLVVVTVSKQARILLLGAIKSLRRYTIESATHEGTIR